MKNERSAACFRIHLTRLLWGKPMVEKKKCWKGIALLLWWQCHPLDGELYLAVFHAIIRFIFYIRPPFSTGIIFNCRANYSLIGPLGHRMKEIKITNYQTALWKQSLVPFPDSRSKSRTAWLESFGWPGQTFHQPPAPLELMDLLNCSCTTGCSSGWPVMDQVCPSRSRRDYARTVTHCLAYVFTFVSFFLFNLFHSCPYAAMHCYNLLSPLHLLAAWVSAVFYAQKTIRMAHFVCNYNEHNVLYVAKSNTKTMTTLRKIFHLSWKLAIMRKIALGWFPLTPVTYAWGVISNFVSGCYGNQTQNFVPCLLANRKKIRNDNKWIWAAQPPHNAPAKKKLRYAKVGTNS